MPSKKENSKHGGRLRIGDDWNAISIIAQSQQSPLKAVAELVENSIDARAAKVTITRGKDKGEPFLRVADDGAGIPRDASGAPDFQYVATHICDSLKRQLRQEDRGGVQGEFGIGLLSFWTLGEELTLVSAGSDGRSYEMRMRRGDPRYSISERRRLFPSQGAEVTIRPLLPGIRHFSGEKIQWYLAAELRDRIKSSGVQIEVVDRQARTRHKVVPREFGGQLLHQLPGTETTYGDVYLELYLNDPNPANHVGLYRHGTRVLEDLSALDVFQRSPWTAGCLQGIIDAPFLNLTPGTRSGILLDERFSAFCTALEPVEKLLSEAIDEQRRAAEERASREILRAIHRAFREALLSLPAEEYDWFQIPDGREGAKPGPQRPAIPLGDNETISETAVAADAGAHPQKEFFDFPGPLYSVVISPASSTVSVGQTKSLRAVPRDRERRLVEENLTITWVILEGGGELQNADAEIVSFVAPQEPGLTRLGVCVRQTDTECRAEGLITVTDALLPESPKVSGSRQGLPAYTFHRAPGELWRSRYEEARNLIIINNAHRDFIYSSRNKALKLRYICRLYIKELVHQNFPGLAADRLLERMVELSLYTEEHLR
ncbi:MAG TPA: ATP-binding protein [Acidobacteriota bacterium]|nr:ATP-binding protein [Acidobacteriota bacterium]